MYATIEPVQTYPVASTILTISGVVVQLGNCATYQWALAPATEGAPLASGSLIISGTAYDAWGANDAYLYEYTAKQLGLTIVKIVTDIPAAADTQPPEASS
jgi:hypothetical protein